MAGRHGGFGRAAVALLGMAAPLWLGAPAGAADTVTLGGPFELTDQNGVTRTAEDFYGSYPLIYFGFTYCPDLCPTTLAKMTQALDSLAKRAPDKAARVVPLFITVDPQRDTVAVLRDYVPNFHPRLVGLTGTPEQIGQVARNYGVFYAPVPMGGGNYLMDHSGFILLMGPAGEYLTHFESAIDAAQLAEALERRVVE
ncbi:MAG: SCO family protein [Kiloniellales bacterium]